MLENIFLATFIKTIIISLSSLSLLGVVYCVVEKYRSPRTFDNLPKEHYIKKAVQEMVAHDLKQGDYRSKSTELFFPEIYPISFYDTELFIQHYEHLMQEVLNLGEENKRIQSLSEEVEKYRETRKKVKVKLLELEKE